MNTAERQKIHTLFETKNYTAIYETHADALNEMLMIQNEEEFEDTYCAGAYFLSVVQM